MTSDCKRYDLQVIRHEHTNMFVMVWQITDPANQDMLYGTTLVLKSENTRVSTTHRLFVPGTYPGSCPDDTTTSNIAWAVNRLLEASDYAKQRI